MGCQAKSVQAWLPAFEDPNRQSFCLALAIKRLAQRVVCTPSREVTVTERPPKGNESQLSMHMHNGESSLRTLISHTLILRRSLPTNTACPSHAAAMFISSLSNATAQPSTFLQENATPKGSASRWRNWQQHVACTAGCTPRSHKLLRVAQRDASDTCSSKTLPK